MDFGKKETAQIEFCYIVQFYVCEITDFQSRHRRAV